MQPRGEGVQDAAGFVVLAIAGNVGQRPASFGTLVLVGGQLEQQRFAFPAHGQDIAGDEQRSNQGEMPAAETLIQRRQSFLGQTRGLIMSTMVKPGRIGCVRRPVSWKPRAS